MKGKGEQREGGEKWQGGEEEELGEEGTKENRWEQAWGVTTGRCLDFPVAKTLSQLPYARLCSCPHLDPSSCFYSEFLGEVMT